MLEDSNGRFLRRVKADSTTRGRLVAILGVSLLLVVGTGVLARVFVPAAFVEFVGHETCPTILTLFRGFCTFVSTDDAPRWQSYIVGLKKVSSFVMLGFQAERGAESLGSRVSHELKFSAAITQVDGMLEPLRDVVSVPDSSLTISCKPGQALCSTNVVLIYNHYMAFSYRLSLDYAADEATRALFKGFRFFAISFNPDFAYFLLAFRYLLLAASLVFSLAYALFFRRVAPEDRTFEHRYILWLSLLLVLFNDPLFALTILRPTFFYTIVSNTFVTLFVTSLLLFWSVMLPRIHNEGQSVSTRKFSRLKKTFAGIFFLALVVTSVVGSYITRFDPAFNLGYKHPVVYFLLEFLVVVLVVFLIVALGWQLRQVFSVWGSVITRHRFFFFLTAFYLLLVCFLLLSGLYQSYETDGPKIVLLFFISNVYVIALQISWRFSGKVAQPTLFTNTERDAIAEAPAELQPARPPADEPPKAEPEDRADSDDQPTQPMKYKSFDDEEGPNEGGSQ